MRLQEVSPVVLAYLGDALYEVYIREHVLNWYPKASVNMLHRSSVRFAKAASQAVAIRQIIEQKILNEIEYHWVKKGRNQAANIPKNAKMADYRYATGFESLLGYLHQSNQFERMYEIMEMAMQIVVEQDTSHS